MILNISSYTQEGKGITLYYDLVDEFETINKHVFCKNLYNTTIASSILEILNNNTSINKIIFSVPELKVKQDKIFKIIKQSPLHEIKKDGKVIRKKKLLELWTEEFKGKIFQIKSGEHKNFVASFKECIDWNWEGIRFTALILPDKEEITLLNEDILFVLPVTQKKWISKEDVVPDFEQLANNIAAEIGLHGKVIDIDEEIDRRLTNIEDNFGKIAIDRIVLRTVGETHSSLKRLIQKRANIFATL